jgi:hypothetical protein
MTGDDRSDVQKYGEPLGGTHKEELLFESNQSPQHIPPRNLPT